MKRLCFLMACTLLLLGCTRSNPQPTASAHPQAEVTYGFIQRAMTDSDGGIYTLYSPDEPNTSGILSESQGLMMQYAVLAGNRSAFNTAWGYIQGHMLRRGLVRWRVQAQQSTSVNAVLDDLRIVGALLGGAAKWGDASMRRRAKTISDALLRDCAPNGQLTDFYDWQTQTASNQLTLCYIDLPTLTQLARENDQWQQLAQQSTSLLKNGYMGDDFPFYHTHYRYDVQGYVSQTPMNMIEALYSALHAQRAGIAQPQTIQWLLQRMEDGQELFAFYDPIGPRPTTDMRSTAVYALASIILRESGHAKQADVAIERMQTLRIQDAEHPLYGAFGDVQGQSIHSFDNLMALLAYQAVKENP